MKHQIKLIDNTYSTEEARDLILTLIDSKIHALSCTIFSHEERFGSVEPHYRQRLEELKKERASLVEVFKRMPKEDEIEINSVIELETVKASTPIN